MPYLKPDEIPFESVAGVLRRNDLGSGRKLADVMFCSDYTGLARLKSPQDLSLNGLRMIHRNGHVPIEELCAAIREGL